ncbi:type 4a pilus biogenesis protein PilO [Snodgrassella sp. ESL0253]|uniref:type 4a pilus biogenesis protein PilO n=1 Tax=Snodgrassella sp. ESL0253 TaxID=2705031 RepID=UPI001582A327|nr:type 4a pilus biogenesis protein PilO [Snodgrassella sp. ESL0253]NUE65725.1 type 4a pilus biogenesis protein PilO [Snodgrassella sp. ESL0253]
MAKNIDLKAIDLNSLYQQGKPVQLGIAGGVIVVILVLAYFFVYSGLNEQLSQLKQEEETLKQTYAEKSEQAAHLDVLKAELDSINGSFHSLLKQLPTQAEIPNLIQELHECATKNGLSMDSVTPSQAQNTDSGNKSEQQVIQTLPYNITLTGNYNQISQFMRDVGKLSRIVTLNAIVLKRNDKDNTLTLNAVANTYKALTDAEIKAQTNDKKS